MGGMRVSIRASKRATVATSDQQRKTADGGRGEENGRAETGECSTHTGNASLSDELDQGNTLGVLGRLAQDLGGKHGCRCAVQLRDVEK